MFKPIRENKEESFRSILWSGLDTLDRNEIKFQP